MPLIQTLEGMLKDASLTAGAENDEMLPIPPSQTQEAPLAQPIEKMPWWKLGLIIGGVGLGLWWLLKEDEPKRTLVSAGEPDDPLKKLEAECSDCEAENLGEGG